ncbi:MAG: hypothetical protein AM1032_000150 [Mycoplasmataceae bacterium]|nr:MAG: hypothetical protein AM1032_000150 [Mycoplasmataceae bacterium]
MVNLELQIDSKDYKILKNILSKYPYNFYAYGSRVKGKAKKYSDLDICYYDIPRKEILDLNQELKDSDLSIIIELVSWNNMRSAFQENIQKDLILIQ